MAEFIKPKRKKKEAVVKKINNLMGLPADPCKYQPHPSLVSNTLVGVEIELENVKGFDTENSQLRDYWNVVRDGSLRDNGLEFVLSRPFAGEDLISALNTFDNIISQNGKKLRTTDRTSVHIHIDVRDMTYAQLLRFISLYTTFEEPLFKVADTGNRKSGIFSTSLDNAEGYLSLLGNEGINPSSSSARAKMMNFSKYSACNIGAVQKYGSLEFRGHEGTYDTQRILKWINILLSLRKEAVDNDRDLESIFGDISNQGAEKVFKDIFGKFSDDMMYPDLEFDMFNGLRLAQDIIYSEELYGDIDIPKATKKGESPFAVYYRNRDKARYDSRFSKFIANMESGKSSIGSWSTPPSGGIDYSAAIEALRGIEIEAGIRAAPQGHEQVEIVIDEDNRNVNVEMYN